jgi:hypothetical protein
MRASTQAKRVPGGRSTSAHDRACLYIRRRALEFIQRVHPIDDGYDNITIDLEFPLHEDGRIAGYVDLVIEAHPKQPLRPHSDDYWRGINPALRLDIESRERATWENCRDLFFVEVKTPGDSQSIGELLRQFKFYKHLVDQECAAVTRWEVAAYEQYGSSRLYGKQKHWILATTGTPSDKVRELLAVEEIALVPLDAEKIKDED